MSNIIINPNPSPSEWNSFLTKFGFGNLQQSFEYGEVAKMVNPHTRVIRLLAFNGNSIVGLAQARFNRRFGFGDRLQVGGVYGYGPVVDDANNREEVLTELIRSLEGYAVRNRVSEAFVYSLERVYVLEKLGYVLKMSFNVCKVPLEGVDELWMRIAHNKRRNIRKAQKEGVRVVSSDKCKDLVSFYEMHSLSGKRAGFVPQPFSYFESFLKVFGAFGKARVFLSVFDDKPIAGVFVVVQGDTAYALGAGSLDEFWRVRPNDIVHWLAMNWAYGEGLSYYHMGFVSDPPPCKGSPDWGLWRWKREWNGILERVLVYRKVLMPRFRKFFLSPYEKIYNLARVLNFRLS